MIQGTLAVPYVTDIENFGAPATLITKEPAAGCERELRLSRSGGRFFFLLMPHNYQNPENEQVFSQAF